MIIDRSERPAGLLRGGREEADAAKIARVGGWRKEVVGELLLDHLIGPCSISQAAP
jgi:hypothetical protein